MSTVEVWQAQVTPLALVGGDCYNGRAGKGSPG